MNNVEIAVNSFIFLFNIVLMGLAFRPKPKDISYIYEGEVDFSKLRSPVDVLMNPPKLPSPGKVLEEVSYRENKACHHCGCSGQCR